MAAAMANVLGLPNWRCLTRGNIGRAARHFCGLDKWLVDLLLLGSVEAFVATDLCEFTHLLGIAAKAQRPRLWSSSAWRTRSSAVTEPRSRRRSTSRR
jgi:hypothetical protein